MTKPRRRQAGEGTISEYRTNAGVRYLIKYRVPQPDGSMKVVLRRRSSSGEPWTTRKAAADALGDINAELRKGTHVLPSKLTVGEWLDEWLRGLRLASSTMDSYDKNVRLHVKPHLGATPLARLTGQQLTALYTQLETSGRVDHAAQTGLSPRTVRYIHTILKAALKEAVAEGLLSANPADRAKPPAARSAKAPEIHPWTAEQLATWLTWSRKEYAQWQPAWHLLAFTGVRRGELLALRWRDVDLNAATISVRRSVGVVNRPGGGKTLEEGPTKTGRERSIEIDPDTVELLRAWKRARGELSLAFAREDSLVFGALDGDYLNPDRFSRRFVDQVERCGRKIGEHAPPRIRLHDLRHTHATLLLKAGVPVKVVSERLGHATVTITLETYAHVMPGMGAEAASMFATIVAGGAS